MIADVTKSIITCADCGATRNVKPTPKGVPRTPAGWKHHRDAYYCALCWGKRYVLRAVTIPVAEPIGCSWEELRKQLKAQWVQTTAAANRIMTECYARDVRRTPDDVKMPPMPRMYLYPELRVEFPGLPSQTVASLEQTCQRKYRAVRYQVVWTAAAALPTYRYPTPLPIPGQAWHAWIAEDRLLVSLRLAEGRMELRLKGGHQFRRQVGQFRQIAEGAAIAGEAAIYQRGKSLNLKLAGWVPRPAAVTDPTGILRVRTGKDSLLVAVNAKDESLWNYHGDHLRRWAAEHRRQLQRWADDAKYENRPVPTFAERRKAAAVKFRDRMNSATHEIAAQLAGYAYRRHFAAVEYDDTKHEFCDDFPWFRLRNLIKEKLEARSIEFRASGPAEPETPEPLAEE